MCYRKMKTVLKIKVLLMIGILCGLIFGWFYGVPHHYFYIGMDQSEIEAVCGKGLKIVPAASLLSSPPTEYQKEHTTLYWIPVRSMGVNLYLNYYKKVVCIGF